MCLVLLKYGKMDVEMARIVFRRRILFGKLVKSIKMFYFDVKRED
jgi:hypothetical protein